MASMRLQPGIGETLGTEDRHVAGRPLSPWLTLQSAAAHLGYDGDPRKDADAVRQLAKRHNSHSTDAGGGCSSAGSTSTSGCARSAWLDRKRAGGAIPASQAKE